MRTLLLLLLTVGLAAAGAGCKAPGAPTGPNEWTLQVSDYEAFVDDTLTLLRRMDLPPERVDRAAGLIVTRPATSGGFYEFWRNDAQGGYQRLESSLQTIRRVVTIEITPSTGTPSVTAAAALSPAEPPIQAASRPPDQVIDDIAEGPLTVTDVDENNRPVGAPPRASAPVAAAPAQIAVPQPQPAPALPTGPDLYRVRVQVDKYRYSIPPRQVTTASSALLSFSAEIPTVDGTRGKHIEQLIPIGRDGLLEVFLLSKLGTLRPDVDVVETAPPS
jgi:hypothetical protein